MFVLPVIDLLLLLVFSLMVYRVSKAESGLGALSFVIMGMIIGLLTGVSIFFSLDKVKGWNPYGWWFLASFITTVIGGILGIFIYSNAKKKAEKLDNKRTMSD